MNNSNNIPQDRTPREEYLDSLKIERGDSVNEAMQSVLGLSKHRETIDSTILELLRIENPDFYPNDRNILFRMPNSEYDIVMSGNELFLVSEDQLSALSRLGLGIDSSPENGALGSSKLVKMILKPVGASVVANAVAAMLPFSDQQIVASMTDTKAEDIPTLLGVDSWDDVRNYASSLSYEIYRINDKVREQTNQALVGLNSADGITAFVKKRKEKQAEWDKRNSEKFMEFQEAPLFEFSENPIEVDGQIMSPEQYWKECITIENFRGYEIVRQIGVQYKAIIARGAKPTDKELDEMGKLIPDNGSGAAWTFRRIKMFIKDGDTLGRILAGESRMMLRVLDEN